MQLNVVVSRAGPVPHQLVKVTVLADKGLAGRQMERYAAEEVKVLLARPDRKPSGAGSATWAGCGNG